MIEEQTKMFVADNVNNDLPARREHVVLLALRLICLSAMVALLTLHIRSVRVFRWEQSVSGGLSVTYVVVVVGLALCAGMEECGAKVLQYGFRNVYGMRLLGLAILVILMSLRIRAQRAIRWESTWSEVMLVANIWAILGMVYSVGMNRWGFNEYKAYLCGTGAVLLAINAAAIWWRWRRAGDMTRVVSELLGALGVPIRRQILIKASLSATAAALLLIDFIWSMFHS